MKNIPVEVAIFDSFRDAATYAKSMANQHQEPLHVRKKGSYWSVRAYSVVADSVIGQMKSPETSAVTNSAEYSDGEASAEILDDLISDQDGWAASSEEGWFYPE